MITVRTKKIVGVAAILSTLILAAVGGFARQGPRLFGGPGGHGGPGRRGPDAGLPIPFARDLNLSDAQKAQLKQINDSLAESTKAQHEQLRKLHDSRPDPLTGAAFDEAAVRAAAQARASLEVELEVARARALAQVYALLTDEQKAQLAARRQQFEQHRPAPPPSGEDVPDGR